MEVSKDNDRYVGHSDQSSLGDALQDAVQQALADQPGNDHMVEFEIVKVRGRTGGIAGFRDIWVEISIAQAQDKEKEKEKEDTGKYTTLAVGEEGGELSADLGAGMSARALGEEGGVEVQEDNSGGGGGGDPTFTTMAVGEEGGQV